MSILVTCGVPQWPVPGFYPCCHRKKTVIFLLYENDCILFYLIGFNKEQLAVIKYSQILLTLAKNTNIGETVAFAVFEET